MSTTDVKFMSISDFKATIGKVEMSADIVKNPNTGKLFLSIDGKSYKCQQDISSELPIRVLIPKLEDGSDYNYEEACVVNVKESQNNVLFSL